MEVEGRGDVNLLAHTNFRYTDMTDSATYGGGGAVGVGGRRDTLTELHILTSTELTDYLNLWGWGVGRVEYGCACGKRIVCWLLNVPATC